MTVGRVGIKVTVGMDLAKSAVLVLGDALVLGALGLAGEGAALATIANRVNANQPKSLKKVKDNPGISMGEKVVIVKDTMQGKLSNLGIGCFAFYQSYTPCAQCSRMDICLADFPASPTLL